VKQTPEFAQVVLHWGATQYKFVPRLQVDCHFVHLRLMVLYFLCLIKDGIVPISLNEEVLLASEELVRSYYDSALGESLLNQLFLLLFRLLVQEGVDNEVQ